jgi:protein tyrosine phosphatase
MQTNNSSDNIFISESFKDSFREIVPNQSTQVSLELKPSIVKKNPHKENETIVGISEKALNEIKEGIENHSNSISIRFKALKEKTKEHSPEEVWPKSSQKIYTRFPDILCPKATSIAVERPQGATGFVTEFLHANEVHQLDGNKYIATQAPNVNTTVSIQPFWQTCFEKKGTIIDLTTLKDHIAPYGPTEAHTKKPRSFGAKLKSNPRSNTLIHLILNKEEKPFEGLLKQTITMTRDVSGESLSIPRYHYTKWLDKDSVNPLELLKLIETLDEEIKESTPIVHCRAGVGRTGTLITAWTFKHMFDKGEEVVNENNYLEVIDSIILKGREDRDSVFVQTPGQYAAIIKLAEHLLATRRN